MKSRKPLWLLFSFTMLLWVFLDYSFAHHTGANRSGTITGVPVHQQIALQAIDFLGDAPQAAKGEIKRHLTRSLYAPLHRMCRARYETGYDIIGGAGDEDQVQNPVWCPGNTIHSPPYGAFPDQDGVPNNGYFEHFWNADKAIVAGGLDLTQYTNPVNPLEPLGTQYTSAYLKAQAIWDKKILPLYASGEKKEAYYWLGRVVHLLEDLTVPAHVHNDPHGLAPNLGDDSYEDFFKSNPSKVFEYGGSTYNGTEYHFENLQNLNDSIWAKVYPGGSPPNLFKLFWYTAQRTQYFASDGNLFREGGFEGDRGRYTTVSGKEKFFSPNLWEGETIGTEGNVRIINLNQDIITDPDQLEKTFVGSRKNLKKLADALIPHALKAVAGLYRLFWLETHPYDDFNVVELDPSKWDTLEFVREIRNGKLISKVRSAGPFVTDFLTLRSPAGVTSIQARVTVQDISESFADLSQARLFQKIYNDGSSAIPGVGDIGAQIAVARHWQDPVFLYTLALGF